MSLLSGKPNSVGAILYGGQACLSGPRCPITTVPFHEGDHKGSPIRD